MSKLRKINVSEVEGNEDSVFPPGTVWIDSQNSLRLSDGETEGGIAVIEGEGVRTVYPTAGNVTAGIIFPDDPEGGSGDAASIKWYGVDGEEMRLHVKVRNDSEDEILIDASGPVKIKTAGDTESEKLWTFETGGNLTLPGGSVVETTVMGDVQISAGNDGEAVYGIVAIRTNSPEVTNQWVFGTDGSLNIPGNTVTSSLYTDNNGFRLNLEGNNSGVTTAKLVLDNDNGHIRLIVGNVSTPAIWAFRDNGNVTFPDSTVQTTAWNENTVDWAGIVGTTIQNNGLPVGTSFTQPVPASSIGVIGDTAGTVAFDNSYIYYCTADFVLHETPVTVNSTEWGGSAGTLTSLPFLSEARAPEVGWTIQVTFNTGPATLTITGVTPLGENRYTIDFNSVGEINVSNGNAGTLIDDDPAADIWVRVAWGEDTW